MASPTWSRHESLASKGCVMHSTNTRRSYPSHRTQGGVIDEAALTNRMAEVRARLKSYT